MKYSLDIIVTLIFPFSRTAPYVFMTLFTLMVRAPCTWMKMVPMKAEFWRRAEMV